MERGYMYPFENSGTWSGGNIYLRKALMSFNLTGIHIHNCDCVYFLQSEDIMKTFGQMFLYF